MFTITENWIYNKGSQITSLYITELISEEPQI